MTETTIDTRITIAVAEIDIRLGELNSNLIEVSKVQDMLLDLRSLLTK